MARGLRIFISVVNSHLKTCTKDDIYFLNDRKIRITHTENDCYWPFLSAY